MLGLLPRFGTNNGWSNQRARVLNGCIKEVCEENGVEFIDVWAACHRSWVAKDGIHLNWKGNQEVGKMVLDSLNSKN